MAVSPRLSKIVEKEYKHLEVINNAPCIKSKLSMVRELSESFKCKVGAIIVIERTEEVIAFGYNVSTTGPMEVHSCCGKVATSNVVKLCCNCANPYKLITLDVVMHAEITALAMLSYAPYTDERLKMYISRTPCERCRKFLEEHNIDWEVIVC